MLFKSICRVCAGFKCVECLYARVLQRSCPPHCDHMVSLHHSCVIFHPSITRPNSAAADIPLTTCLGVFFLSSAGFLFSFFLSPLCPQLLSLAPPVTTCLSHESIVWRVTCLSLSVSVSRCVQEIRNSEM